MKEKVESLIAEHERLFPHKIIIDQALANVRATVEADLRFPQLARLLSTLEKARQQGIADSTLLLPSSPRGIAMVMEWVHENPAGENRPEFVESNRQLFQLAHMLRQDQSAANFFVEGPSYDFSHPQPDHIMVSGTSVPLYSEEGQQYLIANPKCVDMLVGKGGPLAGKSFFNCLWHQQFPGMHGIEMPSSHSWLLQEMPRLRDLSILTGDDLLLIDGLLKQQTAFSQTIPKVCIHRTYQIPLPELISKCERYCDAVELFTQIEARRNDEIISRMEETIQTGIPKVVCGRFHSVNLRKLSAEHNIGLVIAKPLGSPPIDDSYFQFQADERNTNYHIIKFIIPQLKAIANQ